MLLVREEVEVEVNEIAFPGSRSLEKSLGRDYAMAMHVLSIMRLKEMPKATTFDSAFCGLYFS